MNATVLYCYDAYCGWCYGFSASIIRLQEAYQSQLHFEVLSGGMILPETPRHIGLTASYIKDSYQKVEQLSGIEFGPDYLWHINNPDQSDWFPDSTMPSVALCIFKEYFPERQVQFASDLQYSLYFEGRDLCDAEAYRHLVEKYDLPVEAFFQKLKSNEYKETAAYEFALVKQLQVTGFPTVLLQISDTKFYLLCRGFASYEMVRENLEKILTELNIK